MKLDTLYSHFSDDAVAQGFARDFYVPGSTPVSGKPGHSYFNFSAKETRLWLGSNTEVQGYKVGAYVEADFLSGQNPQTAGSTTPDARITNAYNPALRRAYITLDNWLFGQDWSTFQNVAVLPETADFIGPTEGTVFVRQPQIRYTYGGFQFAVENPETWAYAHGASTASKTDDAVLPDFVARYNLKSGFGDFSAAALARQLKVQSPSAASGIAGADDTAFAWAVSLAGKIPVQPLPGDDIRFMLNGGRGMGRYVALASVGDAGVDANGHFTPVTLYSGFVAYRHQWDPRWRSTLMLEALEGNNMANDSIGATATKRSESVAGNLFYSPFKNMNIGGEYRYGYRTDVAGANGSLSRFQFSVKYLF
ncbi:MAG: DcaP family trimeric outer membrane transporter [Nevskia sp.]|nr:DcaP family trimeric outer membrane transporter [Nevskia sp.]